MSAPEEERARWLLEWSRERLAAFEPLAREFHQLLHAEAQSLIGNPRDPAVAALVAGHQGLLRRVEAGCEQRVASVEGPLREVLAGYVQEMGARERGVNRMSRLLPLCITELRPGLSEDVLADLIHANVWEYEALRIQDDLLDEPERVRPEWVLLAGTFHRWFTELYSRHAPDPRQFYADYERFHDEMNNAILQERATAWRPAPCTLEHLRTAGQRAALIKLCASSLLSLQGQRELLPTFDRYMDLHLAIRQLLDDLQDFTQDVEQRRLSAPISMTWEPLAAAGEETPTPALFEAGVVLLDAVPRCLELARHMSEEARDCLRDFPRSVLHHLMTERLERLPRALRSIQSFQEGTWRAVV
jgi:hypothetical protein